MLERFSFCCMVLVSAAVLSTNVSAAEAAGQAEKKSAQVVASSGPADSEVEPAIPYIHAVALSRWVLVALEQAKETNNYTVLSALGSSEFRKANPPQKLAETFEPQRGYRTSKLITENPQFTEIPVLTSPGHLTMAGFYVAGPLRERFRIAFALENDEWRVSELSVALDLLQPSPETNSTPASSPAKSK